MTELEKAVEAYIENPANYLEYQDGWEDLSDVEYVEKAFKAGAEWQYEQFGQERLNFEPRLKHCDSSTAIIVVVFRIRVIAPLNDSIPYTIQFEVSFSAHYSLPLIFAPQLGQ